MAVAKSIAKSAALYSEGRGSAPEIAMPPLPEEPTDSVVEQIEQTQEIEPEPVEVAQEETQAVAAKDSSLSYSQSKSQVAQESFKSIREAKEKVERERDELLNKIIELQNQQVEKKVVYTDTDNAEEDFNIDEDALVEGRHVKKVVKEIKNLRSQLKEYQNQTHQVAVESKIKTAFPDFEKVVSKENVEILNHQFPEIAESLRDTQDMYSKAAAAYKIMKTFGIYKDPLEQDRSQALKNSLKPRPLASVNPQQGDSPLSRANAFANGLTEELKEQLRKEMNAAKRAL
jgi:archaellum component FlaF (FlaF/FlaG flagellin family)